MIPTVDCDWFQRESGCTRPEVDKNAWTPKTCFQCQLREHHPRTRPVSGLQLAVVIISHNYGRFLGEAIASVKAQSAVVSDILVVDDASSDNTREVAESCGVRYLRIEARNVTEARKAGLEATRAPIVCFLDGDDMLPRQYIQAGLEKFDAQVGIVYSDVDRFGATVGENIYPAAADWRTIDRENCIHAASLVRRAALEASRAFAQPLPITVQDDWFLWRKVLECGWRAVKQTERLLHRRHDANASLRRPAQSYYDRAGLGLEKITIAIPLAGRWKLWQPLVEFLESQAWPREQLSLLLLDTSQDEAYSGQLREWVRGGDYPDIRLITEAFGRAGLANAQRTGETLKEVRRVMAQIYAEISRNVTTRFVWIVEDDVIPPSDGAGRLLRGFSEKVESVSGLVPFRPDNGKAIAWDNNGPLLISGEGVTNVVGNGFGCVMMRRSALQAGPIGASAEHPNYDAGFYSARRLGAAKLDWSVRCAHRDNPL